MRSYRRQGACGRWGIRVGLCGLGYVWARGAFAREPRSPACACRGGSTRELVFRCLYLLLGVGLCIMSVCVTLRSLGSGRLFGPPVGLPGPVGFVLWAPGSSVRLCFQVLYLYFVFARGALIRCTLQLGARLTLRVMSRACLYSSGCGWWRKKRRLNFMLKIIKSC